MKLRNLIRNNFLLHSARADALIESIGLSGQDGLRLDKSMPDKSAAKNRVLHKRELAKYLLTQIYSKQLENEIPYKYKNRYDKERILYSGSAFSQWFAKNLLALKKWNKTQLLEDPDYSGNTFLQNLSVTKSPGVNLWFVRFSKGTSVTQAEIEELQADFDRLRNLIIDNGKVRLRTADELLTAGEYTPLQRDFVKYSVVNYGFKFSAANYAYFLPPSIYKEIDNQFATEWKKLEDSELQQKIIQDHLEISMVAQHAEKLPYISRGKAAPIQNGSQFIDLGFDTKEEKNYTGFDRTPEGYVFYDRKFKLTDYKFPPYYREGDGRSATAFKRVYITDEKEENRYVYYQRVGRPIDNTYQSNPTPNATSPLNAYNVKIKFSPRNKVIHLDNPYVKTFSLPYDVSALVGEQIFLTDRNDYARVKTRTVEITNVRKSGNEWKVTVSDVGELASLEYDYRENSTFAMGGTFTRDTAKSIQTVASILNNENIQAEFEYSPAVALMANRLLDFRAIGNIPVITGTFSERRQLGLYTYGERGTAIRLASRAPLKTAIHEITHAYTAGLTSIADLVRERTPKAPGVDIYKLDSTKFKAQLDKYSKIGRLNKAEQQFIKDIVELYQTVSRESITKSQFSYALSSVSEFVAEAVSNKEFRDYLDTLSPSTVKYAESKKSLLSLIKDILTRLFAYFTGQVVGDKISALKLADRIITDYIETKEDKVFANDFYSTFSLGDIDQFQQTSEEFEETEHPTTKRSVYERKGKLYKRVSDIVDIFKNKDSDTPWYT